ncbi:MAG: type II toxin-antitoxin system HipA family toxin [Atopobiaceae bacterium]|nr:type II toxin-antitoxin system HipA family toxin [Atopobiaceae bacterium]
MRGRYRTLLLFIAGTFAGHVLQDADGALSFAYDPSYSGPPVSLSMPIAPIKYSQRVIRPYLMGLLPDDPTVRADIANRYNCSSENPFALLSHIGLDCPGAVQLVLEDATHLVESRPGNLAELSDSDLEKRLHLLRERASSPWETGRSGRWSLGGAQSKMALRYQDGRWYECEGSEPTTHILKPGVTGYVNQALDEYLCQSVAAQMGLPAAQVKYLTFGSEHAVSIQRYDRIFDEDGTVVRIHQEDLCQALSIDPSRKYAEQGGPSSPDVLSLLGTTNANAPRNLQLFVLYLLFNYLMGATDAHAKNYSVLLGTGDTALLAPLYDIASIAPYQSLSPRRRKPLRAAMSIGGENRFGLLSGRHLERLSRDANLITAGITREWIASAAERMATEIPSALQVVLNSASKAHLAGIEQVGPALIREIGANCRRFLEQL